MPQSLATIGVFPFRKAHEDFRVILLDFVEHPRDELPRWVGPTSEMGPRNLKSRSQTLRIRPP